MLLAAGQRGKEEQGRRHAVWNARRPNSIARYSRALLVTVVYYYFHMKFVYVHSSTNGTFRELWYVIHGNMNEKDRDAKNVGSLATWQTETLRVNNKVKAYPHKKRSYL